MPYNPLVVSQFHCDEVMVVTKFRLHIVWGWGWRRNSATHCCLAGIIVSIYILSELATSLTTLKVRCVGANMKLGGVIYYLLCIADKWMKDATRRNLNMFHQLCRNKAFARLVLVTTNWGEVEEDLSWPQWAFGFPTFQIHILFLYPYLIRLK